MNLDVHSEDVLSPMSSFLFYPMSPRLFHDNNDLDPIPSPLPSNTNTDLYPDDVYGRHDPWQTFTELSPVTEDDTYSPTSSASWNSLSNEDSPFLPPLDGVQLPTDCVVLNFSDEQCSSEDWSSTSEERSPGGSVTSKLKSVLMSRKRLRDIDNSSISAIHSYSGEKKRKHDTQNERGQNCGGNKYYPNSSLRFPPCFVCGGTASGLHYGVNSCEPCKGFFTRYLRRKEDEYYKCGKQGKCSITNKLRGNCSACRLQKCLSLGMSRKNSRLGRYSLSRRMETITQVNELENKSIDETQIQNNPIFNAARERLQDTEADDKLTRTVSGKKRAQRRESAEDLTEEKNTNGQVGLEFTPKLVEVLVGYMELIKPYGEDLETEKQITDKLKSHYESYILKIELFGNLKSVPKDEYFNLLKGFGIEIDKRMVILKQGANEIMDVIERYCNFAKQLPHFKLLSNRDQSNLLKSSRFDFFMILMHEGYSDVYKCFLAHNDVAFHQEEVADKFFSRQLVMRVCDTYHRLQKLRLNKEEKALLIAISLLFTDRCTLENRQLVEQIQLSLTQLLIEQLEIASPKTASRRFTKIIDCLISMRESSELYLQEYNQLCKDEYVIEEVPIMTELLFEDK